MIFNRCRKDRIFPYPFIVVLTFGLNCKFTASFLSTLGRNSLVIAPLFPPIDPAIFLCFLLASPFYSPFCYPAVCYVVVLSCFLRKSICGFVSIYPGVSFLTIKFYFPILLFKDTVPFLISSTSCSLFLALITESSVILLFVDDCSPGFFVFELLHL